MDAKAKFAIGDIVRLNWEPNVSLVIITNKTDKVAYTNLHYNVISGYSVKFKKMFASSSAIAKRSTNYGSSKLIKIILAIE